MEKKNFTGWPDITTPEEDTEIVLYKLLCDIVEFPYSIIIFPPEIDTDLAGRPLPNVQQIPRSSLLTRLKSQMWSQGYNDYTKELTFFIKFYSLDGLITLPNNVFESDSIATKYMDRLAQTPGGIESYNWCTKLIKGELINFVNGTSYEIHLWTEIRNWLVRKKQIFKSEKDKIYIPISIFTEFIDLHWGFPINLLKSKYADFKKIHSPQITSSNFYFLLKNSLNAFNCMEKYFSIDGLPPPQKILKEINLFRQVNEPKYEFEVEVNYYRRLYDSILKGYAQKFKLQKLRTATDSEIKEILGGLEEEIKKIDTGIEDERTSLRWSALLRTLSQIEDCTKFKGEKLDSIYTTLDSILLKKPKGKSTKKIKNVRNIKFR